MQLKWSIYYANRKIIQSKKFCHPIFLHNLYCVQIIIYKLRGSNTCNSFCISGLDNTFLHKSSTKPVNSLWRNSSGDRVRASWSSNPAIQYHNDPSHTFHIHSTSLNYQMYTIDISMYQLYCLLLSRQEFLYQKSRSVKNAASSCSCILKANLKRLWSCWLTAKADFDRNIKILCINTEIR